MTALPPLTGAQAHATLSQALRNHAAGCLRTAGARRWSGPAHRAERERLRIEGRWAALMADRLDANVSPAQVTALLGLRP